MKRAASDKGKEEEGDEEEEEEEEEDEEEEAPLEPKTFGRRNRGLLGFSLRLGTHSGRQGA